MTEPVDESILDKLKKLMAHRDSADAIGSQKEAEAFAARIQFLLNKYKLEEADVNDHDEEKRRINSTPADFAEAGMPKAKQARRVWWTETLGRVVANNYMCRMMVDPRSNTLYFAGRPVDREVAVFVYITLARAAMKMADKLHKARELVRHLTDEPMNLRGFRESFYEGFVDGIRERLAAMKKDFTDENPGFALVLVKSDKELQEWIDLNTSVAKGHAAGGNGNNDLGYAAGKAYAKDVPLQTGVGGQRGQKRLN